LATTRIHDLAAEFGISSDQLMTLLREMNIFVRSHLTPLMDEQVSMMRARWEREKRKQREPATPPKRRRAAAKVVEAPAPVVDARPTRRRRTAAEVAAADAEAQAEAEREAEVEANARLALEAAKAEEESRVAFARAGLHPRGDQREKARRKAG